MTNDKKHFFKLNKAGDPVMVDHQGVERLATKIEIELLTRIVRLESMVMKLTGKSELDITLTQGD